MSGSWFSLRLALAPHHVQEVVILRRPALEPVQLRAPGLKCGREILACPAPRHGELRGRGYILEERSERRVRGAEAGGGTRRGVTRSKMSFSWDVLRMYNCVRLPLGKGCFEVNHHKVLGNLRRPKQGAATRLPHEGLVAS